MYFLVIQNLHGQGMEGYTACCGCSFHTQGGLGTLDHAPWGHARVVFSAGHSFSKTIQQQLEYTKRLDSPHHFSSHHSFSFRTCSSSAGVKSFLMLNVFLISSGVFPLIMLATVLQVTSRSPLISR